jgi:hypothetical protein
LFGSSVVPVLVVVPVELSLLSSGFEVKIFERMILILVMLKVIDPVEGKMKV